MVIDDATAGKESLHVGQTVGMQADGPAVQMRISGIIHFGGDVATIGVPKAGVFAEGAARIVAQALIAELGDAEADPKRHYLSPKIVQPWFKLLYFTPALFPIYFRAARKETATYPPEIRRRIARERWATILFHVGVMAAIFAFGTAPTCWAMTLPSLIISKVGTPRRASGK